MKKAFFRFEASSAIGAGHAVRSCVIADRLFEEGWECFLVTSKESYDFIPDLKRFHRINPEDFYEKPESHDLLVIDHYDLDINYEKHFRVHANKIMVIDDLANRYHDCDVLLDQTYGREVQDYKKFVPEHCQILTGSDYVLLRKEFVAMRTKALEKRKQTKKIERILISMGGGDSGAFTIKALEKIKDASFLGHIDIVLGFQACQKSDVEAFIKTLPNSYTIHVNPDMAELMYKADLSIGAAGSSVWERCCLGLPQILIQTADNQTFSFSKISKFSLTGTFEDINLHESLFAIENSYQKFVDLSSCVVDGNGVQKIIEAIF